MKKRRQFLKKLGGLTALFAVAGPAHSACTPATKPAEGNFLHVVFFWLVDDSENTRKKFLEELRKFVDHVDEIKTMHIGSPADTDREVIDNTWTYSLIVSFDSKKEHDIYQEHELHKAFIENASMLWKKVQVYDSVKLG